MTNQIQAEQMFDLAPIAMWIEDFSGVKALFDLWRAEGVEEIRKFLAADLSRAAACSRAIRVLKVNRKTLELFEADDQEHLVANMTTIFRGDMVSSHINELAQLWEGNNEFSGDAVNYTLSGKRLDIQLRGSVLPGHEQTLDRILVTTEDVTDRENARRRETQLRQYAEGVFEHSPVSLWVEDFSRIKALLDEVRNRGIVDLRVFTDVHPEFVSRCMSEIRVIDVNRATLELFCAPDRQTLLQRMPDVFRDDTEEQFREQLIDLWNGNLFHRREIVNYALDGSKRYVLLQFSVFPGREADWSRVQVALTDITARKKAEAYLEYLGKHDVLTRLHNRAFYTEELNRLERKSLRPVSVIIIDLNRLKETNDELGHEAGDNMLRRLGEVLNEAVRRPDCAARIGGDEFAILMPGSDRNAANAMVENINRVLRVNNQFHSDAPMEISAGIATCDPGENLESVVRRADMAMYRQKQEYHSARRAVAAREREQSASRAAAC